MYAILAFKSTRTIGAAVRTLCHFRIASMGCFNGLNDTSAFNWGNGSPDITIETHDDGRPVVRADNGQVNAWGIGAAEGARLNTEFAGYRDTTPVCIGMGYLSYLTGSTQKTLAQITGNNMNITPENGKNNVYLGSMLMREGFLAAFRDPVFGGQRATLRELTPNEQYLSNLCAPINNGGAVFSPEVRDTTKMGVTMTANKVWHGQLYQMVGSERPSGQAVAYLQAWRNASQMSVDNGFAGLQGAKGIIEQFASLSRNLQDKSCISLLSVLFNHGDDSDIITFAGNHYVSYCIRVGFWNTANLYRDQRPMTQEGRYNKGGQSTSIRENLHRIRSMASRREHHALWTRELGREADDLAQLNNATAQLGYDVSMSTLMSYARTGYDSQRRDLLQRINRSIELLWNTQPMVKVQKLFNDAAQLPDLTQPAPNAAPVTPPVGFTQWVAQETIH